MKEAKEEIYDFSIIQHTIGQAIAARAKIESERKAMEERDRAVEEERSKREAQDQEAREIKERKADLSANEREKLREKARAALGEDGLSANMISAFLIDVKENELVRKQLEKKR